MRAVMSLDSARAAVWRAGRQLRGELAIGVERFGLLLLERVEIVVGAVEFGEFALELPGARR